MTTLRTISFQTAYWITSVFFALCAMLLVILPTRRPMMVWIRLYTQTMLIWLRLLAGIRIKFEGRENIPSGPLIIAAKHQSWGDGIAMFSQFFDLAFVTGDHLERMPLLGTILRKMGAIVVDNCGGAYARAKLVDEELSIARRQNRRILIYPEGHLSRVGMHHRYRKGVFHMYKAYDKPVVPVATNLGLFWPQQSWRLTPGTATVSFLDPIAPGLDKAAFMKTLETRIEDASLALLPAAFPIPENRLQQAQEDESHAGEAASAQSTTPLPSNPRALRETEVR
ncbi:MAG: 1-acyl-sn-glycerol-3-phosphate acyltransferase [Pseudomonadota bacterium]